MAVSASAKGDHEELDLGVGFLQEPDEADLLVPQESQQVSVVAATDLKPSATGERRKMIILANISFSVTKGVIVAIINDFKQSYFF